MNKTTGTQTYVNDIRMRTTARTLGQEVLGLPLTQGGNSLLRNIRTCSDRALTRSESYFADWERHMQDRRHLPYVHRACDRTRLAKSRHAIRRCALYDSERDKWGQH